MYRYRAFGTLIYSDFPLSLPVESDDSNDCTKGEALTAAPIYVRRGFFDIPKGDGLCRHSIGKIDYIAAEIGLYLEIPWAGRLLIQDENEILVSPLENVDERLIAANISGLAIIFLMKKRGFLTFHASAVSKGGKAFLFLGDKGGGKSTTAAALSLQGYRVLCDDLALISPDGSIYPGNPIARLLPDALGALFGEREGQSDRIDGVLKQELLLAAETEPIPLEAVFVLKPSLIDRLKATELKGFKKAKEIFPHFCSFTDIDVANDLAILIGTCMEGISVYTLERPIGKDSLGEVCDFVKKVATSTDL